VHFQLAVSTAAMKLLPLAACFVVALTILQSPRISAEPATVAPRPHLANSTSALWTPTSASAIKPQTSPAALDASAAPADYPHVIAWKNGSE
jgi:hypothetical protein